MEKLGETYLVAAAVLCIVVTPTSAALPDKSCTTNTDCTGGSSPIANSVCNADGKCECAPEFKEDTGACVAKGLGDSCSTNDDCAEEANSECSTASPKTCVCQADFTAINNDCKKGLGNSCTDSTECSNGVTHSECSTGSPQTCVCSDEYTAINSLCQKGLGNSCTAEADCSAVSNAVCDTDSKVCTCKANYKEDNGKCSSANGLQTLLSAPVALLISFLTVVVTRLH